MIEHWFTATEAFDPSDGEKWDLYIKFSNLVQLKRVVSLDNNLCPNLIKDVKEEDWEHNVQEDFKLHYFKNLDYLFHRIAGAKHFNIFSVVFSPVNDVSNSCIDERFKFMGYDIVDKHGGYSALTNCGGFPNAFQNSELSQDGLIVSFNRAQQINQALQKFYPDEYHAQCDVWAIWLLNAL